MKVTSRYGSGCGNEPLAQAAIECIDKSSSFATNYQVFPPIARA
jgi:hypothetical protein